MTIKKPIPRKGARITASPTIDYEKRPPLFSLEKLIDGDYCLSRLDQEHKAFFAEAIFRRRNLTWADLKAVGRHALGFEKISRNSIQVGIPEHITQDRDYFLAFRFHGLKPMIGYRQLDIFYVLWFDHNFSVYGH